MTMEEKEPLTAREVVKLVLALAVPFLAVALAYWGMMVLYQVTGG